ncbi:MAG: helix-turn-helix domain-containing protein [Bdellovibrionaceae bacterium]|nr:helix-turn-helix domain-containing protein [Pseudobdellovibrionaceae bacterium]
MSNHRQGSNYYEILEVERNAPQNEIHRAYQRAKSTYSTENPALYSMFSKEEAKELLRMIEEAYSVLGNQSQRKIYDQSLADGGVMPASAAKSGNAEPSKLTHEQLPDIAASEPGPSGDVYMMRTKEKPKSTLAPGMARTSVSTYKVDDSFEAEINAITEWTGPLLQKVRTYKNVNVDQISEASRISRTYLNAVENDDFAALPAAVFVRGFVVQISRVLGLDENKVATSYMKYFRAKSGK